MDTNNTIEPTKISNSVHAPEYAPVKENEQVLLSLGMNADHIAALPMIVNTGDSFLLLEVKRQETLRALQPDINNLRLLSEQYGLSGFCLFSQNAELADATCRIFTGGAGSPEEGTRRLAAGALACYLYDIAMIKKDQLTILQGFFKNPPDPFVVKVDLELLQGKIQSWHSTTRAHIA